MEATTTKTGKFIFGNANNYKAEFGTINPKPKSSYIKVGGLHKLIDPEQSLEAAIRSLRVSLKRFVHQTSKELFEDLIPSRTIVEIEQTDCCIKKLSYFAINIDLFFENSIDLKSKEIKDKHQVLTELLVEYLEENRLFIFIPK